MNDLVFTQLERGIRVDTPWYPQVRFSEQLLRQAKPWPGGGETLLPISVDWSDRDSADVWITAINGSARYEVRRDSENPSVFIGELKSSDQGREPRKGEEA